MSDVYASPTGTASGAGTQADPVDLVTGLLVATNRLQLLDGIYALSSQFNIPSIQIIGHGRPIITHTDGYPPAVAIDSRARVSGVWFGGLRPATKDGGRTIVMGSNAVVEDCTLFNYVNGIQAGSDAHGNAFRRIRFVRCGWEPYRHPIYIANENASLPEHGNYSTGLICIGCEGYSIHYYHEPAYGLSEWNFVGDALYGIAIQGDDSGPVSINDTIVWRTSANPLYDNVASGSCDRNLWMGCAQPNPGTLTETRTMEGNYFVDGVPTNGTNPVSITTAQMEALLGHTAAEIDGAIAALEAAFAESIETIHADTTIETSFAVLADVIENWREK